MHLFQFCYLHVIGRSPGLGLPCAETCCSLKKKASLEVHIEGDEAQSWNSHHDPLPTCPACGRIRVSLVMGAAPWQSRGQPPTALKWADSNSN